MAVNKDNFRSIVAELGSEVQLIAVSKLHSADDIRQLYELGQRDFGENYVQELVDKQAALPSDIRWHFIGHLQSNKVKYIAPFVHLIHGVDSAKLLKEINKQAKKAGRVINCLLQVHIATEETKFGLDESELSDVIRDVSDNSNEYSNILIQGLMGMASFSDDPQIVEQEFSKLQSLYERFKSLTFTNIRFSTLSMGMSGDYKTALKFGSNMVRIGSLLFGARK